MIYQSSMIHHDRDHHHHDHDINHHDHNRYSIDHHDHHNIDDHAHEISAGPPSSQQEPSFATLRSLITSRPNPR